MTRTFARALAMPVPSLVLVALLLVLGAPVWTVVVAAIVAVFVVTVSAMNVSGERRALPS